MPRDLDVECFLEAVGNYLSAREDGDKDGMARAIAEAEGWLAGDWPIERIRETVRPTVEEWLRDYGHDWDRSHAQLVNRVAAAVYAMLHPAGRT
jgi:hypothetical protein